MWCKNNPPFPYVTTFTSNKHRNRWWLGAIGPIFPRVTCKIILVINKIVDQRDVKARWPWPFAAYFALRGDPRTFAGTCTRVTNGHEYSVARTTAEIYSERWCRQLAHPPPRRINFISTVLSDHPRARFSKSIRCLTSWIPLVKQKRPKTDSTLPILENLRQ